MLKKKKGKITVKQLQIHTRDWIFDKSNMSGKCIKPVDSPTDDVVLKDIQPSMILSKLPFHLEMCPLFVSSNGNSTALYRYSNSGPFIELLDPSSDNLIPGLKYSISQGSFCNFNFGIIQHTDDMVQMLDRMKKACARTHSDLYNHLIHNSLMKQPFEKLMALIPFDRVQELGPETFEKSKETFRCLFFVQSENPAAIKQSFSSIFHCICVRPWNLNETREKDAIHSLFNEIQTCIRLTLHERH